MHAHQQQQVAYFGEQPMFSFPRRRRKRLPVYKDKGSSWKGLGKKPAKPNTTHERATTRAQELVDIPLQKKWQQSEFAQARSTLEYLRTQRNTNRHTIHASLDLLERMLLEVQRQEQMYRSDWCHSFKFVEPLLLNWCQAWREEWDREQDIYTPRDLLAKMQNMAFPEGFDPENKVVETILCGMIEVAHKFDKPEFGEEFLVETNNVTHAMCHHVLHAWIISEHWNGKDIEGAKQFVHTMVDRYSHIPDLRTFQMLADFLGEADAITTCESALSNLPVVEQIQAFAKMELLDVAHQKMIDPGLAYPKAVETSLQSILLACGDDYEKALEYYNLSTHMLDDSLNGESFCCRHAVDSVSDALFPKCRCCSDSGNGSICC